MSGASLVPEFYKEKLNVAVFLAPPASMKNTTSAAFKMMGNPQNRALLTQVMDAIGFYNFLPYNYMLSKPAQVLCSLLDG